MKKINVEMSAFYGYGCGYGSNESFDAFELEVDDTLVTLLKDIQQDGIALNQDGIQKCLQGCPEHPLTDSEKAMLSSLHDDISDKHRHMVNKYWVLEAENPCDHESLLQAMEEDIIAGIYQHSLSLEEFMAESGDGYEDEEDAESDYNELIFEEYRDWVFSHDEDTELAFIADRVGCALNLCDAPVEYEISVL